MNVSPFLEEMKVIFRETRTDFVHVKSKMINYSMKLWQHHNCRMSFHQLVYLRKYNLIVNTLGSVLNKRKLTWSWISHRATIDIQTVEFYVQPDLSLDIFLKIQLQRKLYSRLSRKCVKIGTSYLENLEMMLYSTAPFFLFCLNCRKRHKYISRCYLYSYFDASNCNL